MRIDGKHVLVLGGSGFIGSRLIKTLLEKGALVTNFDRVITEIGKQGIQTIHGDFFDTVQLMEAVKGQDVVIHAVSTIIPGNSWSDYMAGYEKEFIQTVKLLKRTAENGQKLIFLSSGGTVYGQTDGMPIGEGTCCRPINHYGSLKVCIESVMQAFIADHADFMIARLANPYGPGQDYKKGVGFIDAAIKHALYKEPLEIWGDGDNVRDYIYIDDACRMLCDLITYEGNERVFNISTGVGVTQKEILSFVRSMVGEVTPVFKPERPVDVKRIVLDNSLYRQTFDFTPRTLQDGILQYATLLKANETQRT